MDGETKIKRSGKKLGLFAYNILILALVIYSGFIVYRQIKLNYQTNLKIDDFKGEIESTNIQNKNLNNLLVYYQSNTYKELEARKRLGMKKAGETIVIAPENTDKAEEVQEEQSIQNSAKDTTPNYQKWFNLIFQDVELPNFKI
ncbi:hypothetical protein CO101_00580 [Candidatus Berkelbacteria bacterium CG_4_9_14_3_um_filter_39_23]|uniref:Septum formation initiator n=1 Tax=Candidatus Berkelbacteria bacterium CG_4_9_14_3_um_filter_39_23 TaxID=1974508 RepID=A0A2M8C6D1_9BACT|nr:MAG: hypothetical protein CO101_00580 [Candidatus Berkelbacteria bacterium CG_4_9_14_3_um_filter_39_23]